MLFKEMKIPDGEFDTYFVTDIHGMYDLLHQAKEEIGYKAPGKNGEVRDRMISCGDMNDRGLRSYDVLQMFRHGPDKTTVLGNHEKMGYHGLTQGGDYEVHWYHNGGNWAYDLEFQRAVLMDVFNWANSLPYALEVTFENGPVIGVVHAGIKEGMSWNEVKEGLLNPSLRTEEEFNEFKNGLIWDRGNFKEQNNHSVKGIDLVLHGHNITEQAFQLGNRVYFDTGAPHISPGGEYGITILKYDKNRNGSMGDGWLIPYRLVLDEDRKLKWL